MSASALAAIKPQHPLISTARNPAQSTAANDDYDPIEVSSLVPIALTEIQRFRDYLRTIPFRYPDTSPTILGRELTIEGDVRAFFDSSILLVVWPVILAMVPTIRNEDLRLAWESPLPGAVKHRPDVTVYLCGAGYETPITHIEYKAPECLSSFQEVVSQQVPEEDVSTSSDTSEEDLNPAWIKITKQLTKYSMNGSSNILCSDGSDAYIFIFPDNDESTDVLWVRASDDGSAVLTLRESLLFLLFFAINSGPHLNLRYVLVTF